MSKNELEKWDKVYSDVRIINDFVDFLNEQKIMLCKHSEEYPSFFLPTLQQRDDIIAQHFGIDLNQLEKERSELLQSIRNK